MLVVGDERDDEIGKAVMRRWKRRSNGVAVGEDGLLRGVTVVVAPGEEAPDGDGEELRDMSSEGELR